MLCNRNQEVVHSLFDIVDGIDVDVIDVDVIDVDVMRLMLMYYVSP